MPSDYQRVVHTHQTKYIETTASCQLIHIHSYNTQTNSRTLYDIFYLSHPIALWGGQRL